MARQYLLKSRRVDGVGSSILAKGVLGECRAEMVVAAAPWCERGYQVTWLRPLEMTIEADDEVDPGWAFWIEECPPNRT